MTNYTPTATARPVCAVATAIAEECIRLGLAPSPYLLAYLPPLLAITDLTQDYGYDSAAGIAGYCLDALSGQEGWIGVTAERLTRELRDHVAHIYGPDFDDLGID